MQFRVAHTDYYYSYCYVHFINK